MNNNRGNNRRRGRNNRSQGGGQHLNRIDSRARGNAPQLLEKYKKLAEEAHRNGDRVQAEYYLQFADHYFRVIADGKARQDEQRQKRDDDRQSDDDTRGQNNDNDSDSENDGEEEEETSNRRQRRRKDGGEENPFTRDSRQRRQRRSRDDEESSDGGNSETEKAVENDGGLDPQALPPAIGETEEKPKRRGRPRKVKAETSDDDDVKQAVNG
ncbi:DUF4167 domain-containing protein [Croceicoccus pelagius]|uniref:DUF4167 domain-containing protein n=1 Tax=Croceicoccus pelagius TaxID=1703341 RepID=A0A916YAI0_9SPHN|nr:DUF4167 domain-containing protein [Croceicoccus pelagius]GGD36946.1 hypothetical protein GCM10010989_08900 [Croceicoccus pelagius]